MYVNQKIRQVIIMSVMYGGLIVLPSVYPVNDVPIKIMSIAHAEVKTYTGVGEDYANEYESQEIAKQRALNNAIRNATEQAGVYLQTYSRSINAILTTDEISVITSNSYKVIGEVHYDKTVNQLSNTVIVIVWKATVQVNVDDAEVRSWLNRDAQDRATLVNQNKSAQQAAINNDQQVEDLRKRVRNATTDAERERIRVEYQQVDNEFLANQKLEEGDRLNYQQDYNGAIAKYNEALQLNLNYVEAYNNRGIVYAKLFNYKQAIADFSKAIELNPNFAGYYCNRGLTYYKSGNFNQAIADYTKVIQLNQDYAEAYYYRGLCYQAIGSNRQSKKDFAKAKQLGYTD